MSDSRLSRDDRSRERSPHHQNHRSSSKKSKKSKKSTKSSSSSYRRRSRSRSIAKRSKSRTPKSSKKSKKSERKRSKSPKKSKKSRSGRGRSPPPSKSDSKRSRRARDKKRGYKAASSCSSSDDWKNTSDEGDHSRSPKRHRGRSSSSSRSRSRSRSSSGSSYGRPPHRNGGYRGKNWRGGGRAPRGRRGGGPSFRPDAPTLRGRGYWRPNYIAYGRNIFPGGESSETHSDSSRSWSSSSSSRSATPEHYKDTPPNSPPKAEKEKTPEKGLMDTIQQQEIERINNIMAQLDRAGKESQQKSNEIRRGQFVGTFGAEKDIFEENVPLRKEFKERADFQKEKQENSFPAKKKAKLFDYDDASLDKGMSLRKQMEQKENKDREKMEEEARKQQLAQEQRIKNRVESASEQVKSENGEYIESGVVITRRRKSTNMRSELDNDEDEEKHDRIKKEPSDAEFVKTLNASFEKERGHKITIKGMRTTAPSFSELAAKMSKTGAGVMRGKVASSGLKSSGFGVPKILGRREANPENKFLKPNLKEHLESMDNQNDMLYKQKKQEEMEKQGEMVQEQILSTAPLQSTNIGPIKPVVQTTVRRLNKTGVVLPVSLLNPGVKSDAAGGTTTTGSSGSHVRTPPVVVTTPTTPGSSGSGGGGWKEPKSGWNESPPRSASSQPVQKIHATPNVTLARVQSETSLGVTNQHSTPPPVIKREYTLAPPIVHQYPPMPPVPPPVIHRVYNTPPPPVVQMPYQHHVAKTSSVILKREFDSDSEGPTPPPPGDSVDLAQVYQRHPQLWQGFVTIKKHAAMVQLHYLAGDKLLVQSVLPVFPTMTGSDNSKHPALKVTSRVRLEESTFASLRAKMQETKKFTFLLGLPCGVSETDVAQQKHTLRVNFMQYFASKAAAGVVEIKCDGIEYLVYMFPQCDLMREQLSKCVDFAKQTADLPQLMIAIFPST